MKKIITFCVFLLGINCFAAEIKILNWYKLNSNTTRDTAAEVCFSLTPKPTDPVFIEITVDKGTNSAGNYGAWIGPKGSVCHVVSTIRGKVSVEVPSLAIKDELIQE